MKEAEGPDTKSCKRLIFQSSRGLVRAASLKFKVLEFKKLQIYSSIILNEMFLKIWSCKFVQLPSTSIFFVCWQRRLGKTIVERWQYQNFKRDESYSWWRCCRSMNSAYCREQHNGRATTMIFPRIWFPSVLPLTHSLTNGSFVKSRASYIFSDVRLYMYPQLASSHLWYFWKQISNHSFAFSLTHLMW